jgi:hypothetical protein
MSHHITSNNIGVFVEMDRLDDGVKWKIDFHHDPFIYVFVGALSYFLLYFKAVFTWCQFVTAGYACVLRIDRSIVYYHSYSTISNNCVRVLRLSKALFVVCCVVFHLLLSLWVSCFIQAALRLSFVAIYIYSHKSTTNQQPLNNEKHSIIYTRLTDLHLHPAFFSLYLQSLRTKKYIYTASPASIS